jgi:hypothetical protein
VGDEVGKEAVRLQPWAELRSVGWLGTEATGEHSGL